MKNRKVVAAVALFAVLGLTLLHIQSRKSPPIVRAVRKASPGSQGNSSAVIRAVPLVRAKDNKANTLATPLESGAIERRFERALPVRMKLENLQSSGGDFVADLTIDGLPLVGSRFIGPAQESDGPGNFVPPLKISEVLPHHELVHGSEAEERAHVEAKFLKDCEIYTTGRARALWFSPGDGRMLPAYAVEMYYRCSHDLTREDWVYGDPNLERVGVVRKRN